MQYKPINETTTKSSVILDYAAKYSNAVIQYHTSDMVLHVDSYAAYLTIMEDQSFYNTNFYLGDWTSPHPVRTSPKINGPIYKECKIILNMVSSSSESETCGTFNNGKKLTSCEQIKLYYTTNNQ